MSKAQIILIVISFIAGALAFAFFIIAIKKDKSKASELISSLLFSVFFVILPTLISVSPVFSLDSEPQTEQSTEPPTESPTEPPTERKASNQIKNSFTYTDQSFTVNFTAPVGGLYRFDYDINDVNYDYYVYLYDSKNQVQIDSCYSNYEHGDSCELIEGETYKLIVQQKDGLPEFTIDIGVPTKSAVIQLKGDKT